MKSNKIIPIFYTCDDTNAKSTIASIRSIIKNADKSYNYTVCILHNGINRQNMKKMFELTSSSFNITLEDISLYTRQNKDAKVSFSSDFVRAFIPEMFPGYPKSILVSSDYVAAEDIGTYFNSNEVSSSLLRIGC